MDFIRKASILSDVMLLRNDLDERLLDFFLDEANDLAVRYAVGIDLGHIHQLSTEAEMMIERAFQNLLWEFAKPPAGNYRNIADIIPANVLEQDEEDYVTVEDFL